MKICFIGKYPPIEGGVSMQSYWTVRGVAELGHEVYVVTNADEVENVYRLYFEEDDKDWYEPRFESARGFVRVRNTERFGSRKISHIPFTNPFVTKLASVATQTIRQHNCEVIVASYFEPYGVAGFLASQWTGVPYVIKHAGSDLDRLMKAPDLSTAYKEILKRAARVLTTEGLVERFARMGVDEDRIRTDIKFSVPTELFNPSAAPMDVNGFLQRITARDPAWAQNFLKWHANPVDLAKPTIGVYGKVGEFKGSYDLVRSLSRLKEEGLDFNFLTMTHGWQGEQFRQALREAGLEERTWILPFVPHWRVPGFIRACTAVCFLERDFPIAIHGPTIPREVMACGTCLVLSGEIASKQSYRDRILDGENVLVVADPKAHDELAAKLRLAIRQPEAARRIGLGGYEISQTTEDFPAFTRQAEHLLQGLTGREAGAAQASGDGRDGQQLPAAARPNGEGELAEALAAALPCTCHLLSGRLQDAVLEYRRAAPAQNGGGFRTAIKFCDLLGELSRRQEIEPVPPYFRDILRLERTGLALSVDDDESDKVPPFTGADRFRGREVREELVGHLRPSKNSRCRIEEFDYDVAALVGFLKHKETPPEPPPRGRTLILFYTAPNLTSSVIKINGPTKDLLELCDGARTTRSLLTTLAQLYGLGEGAGADEFRRGVLSTLGSLYEKGIIIFC